MQAAVAIKMIRWATVAASWTWPIDRWQEPQAAPLPSIGLSEGLHAPKGRTNKAASVACRSGWCNALVMGQAWQHWQKVYSTQLKPSMATAASTLLLNTLPSTQSVMYSMLIKRAAFRPLPLKFELATQSSHPGSLPQRDGGLTLL